MNPELCARFTAAGKGEMLDFPRLINLCYWLMRCEGIEGEVAEFGCHKGHTGAMLAAITKKRVWLFDSFKGLPAKSSHDITRAEITEGAMRCDRFECEANLDGLEKPPIVTAKWFKDVDHSEMPYRLAFVHIDGDFYSSTMDALRLVYPHLSKGAMVFIDDYKFTTLPGVKVATDEFLRNKPEKLTEFWGPCGAMVSAVCFTKL